MLDKLSVFSVEAVTLEKKFILPDCLPGLDFVIDSPEDIAIERGIGEPASASSGEWEEFFVIVGLKFLVDQNIVGISSLLLLLGTNEACEFLGNFCHFAFRFEWEVDGGDK